MKWLAILKLLAKIFVAIEAQIDPPKVGMGAAAVDPAKATNQIAAQLHDVAEQVKAMGKNA